MVWIRHERFLQGVAKKLHAHSAGPFRILKRIGPNAYVLDLPLNMSINPTFNVDDLVPFQGPTTIPTSPFHDPNNTPAQLPLPLPPSPPIPHYKEEIENILDDQVVSTKHRGYQKYLVKWKNRPHTNCTWITKDEL